MGDDVWFVEAIEHQWYGPDAVYFRVRADDATGTFWATTKSKTSGL
jgi:hypothetical protein